MQRVLTLFVAGYWAAFFTVVAVAAGNGAMSGSLRIFRLAEMLEAFLQSIGPRLSGAVALAATLLTALFLWLLFTAILHLRRDEGETEEVARIVFAVATGATALVLLSGLVTPTADLLTHASIQLLALLVSYLAIRSEGQELLVRTAQDREESVQVPLSRRMAIGAAREVLMPRIARSQIASRDNSN